MTSAAMATSSSPASRQRPRLGASPRLRIGRRGAMALAGGLLALVLGGLAVGGLWGPTAAGSGPAPGGSPTAMPAPSTPWAASLGLTDPAGGPVGPTLGGGVSGSLWPPAAPTFSGPDPLDLVAKTALVLGLLYLALRLLRRVGAAPLPRPGGRLRVLESQPLGPRAALHLVEVGDRCLVVGQTAGGLVALAELDAAEMSAQPVPGEVEPARHRSRVYPSRFLDGLGGQLRREEGR